MFSLGGKCPPDSREISDPRYSKHHHVQQAVATGLSPSTVPRSRGVSLMLVRTKRRVYNTTSPLHFHGGIRFGLCCVHSPLLTASQLISSPAPTQMFQLRAFPTLTGRVKKTQEFPLGNPRIKGSMRLPVAYRSLARPSSVLEPSHSPDGIATPKDITTQLNFVISIVCTYSKIPTPQCFTARWIRHTLALHSNSASKDNHVHSFNPQPGQTSGVSSSPSTLLDGCIKHHDYMMKVNLCEYSRPLRARASYRHANHLKVSACVVSLFFC